MFLLALIGGLVVATVFNWSYALGVFATPMVAFGLWTRYIARSSFSPKFEATLALATSLCKSILQFLFLTFTNFDAALIYGDFVGIALSFVVAAALLPKVVQSTLWKLLRTPLSLELLKRAGTFMVPLWFAGEVFTVRNTFVDYWTRALLGARAMGALGMSGQIWKVAWGPIDLFGHAVLPGLVKAEGGKIAVYDRAVKFSLAILPCFGIAAAAASPLILRVFELHEKFAEVPPLLWIATLTLPSTAAEVGLHQLSIAEGRNRPILIAQAFTLGVMFLVVYPLGTTFGLVGMAIVGLCGQVAQLGGLMLPLWFSHRTQILFTLRAYLRGMLGIAVAMTPVYLTRHWEYNWVSFAPALILYLGTIFLLKVITPRELWGSFVQQADTSHLAT